MPITYIPYQSLAPANAALEAAKSAKNQPITYVPKVKDYIISTAVNNLTADQVYSGVYFHALMLYKQGDQAKISQYLSEKYPTLTSQAQRDAFKAAIRNAHNDSMVKPVPKGLALAPGQYQLKEDLAMFHFYQKSVKDPRSGMGCTAASYVMAKAMVDPGYAINAQNYKNTLDGLSVSKSAGAGIDQIWKYDQDDSIKSVQKDINIAKNFIAQQLSEGHPIIARIRINEQNGTLVTSGTGKPFDGDHVTGHFVTIVGLNPAADGNPATITYLDPLTKDPAKAVKTIGYDAFLKSMKEVNYNLLAITA